MANLFFQSECPSCNHKDPIFIKYWNDQGDTKEEFDKGNIIYAANYYKKDGIHPMWHCKGCDYEWTPAEPDEGHYRKNYKFDIFGSESLCPKCESTKIGRYLYGMPEMDEKLEQDVKNGEIIIGGCSVTIEDPEWHCNDCKNDW